MGLTRSMLKGMGLNEEQVSAIIDAHVETVDALKDERDDYKEKASKLKDVEKELDGLKKDGGTWQEKYEKEHSDFEAYKKDRETADSKQKVKDAYHKLLKETGVDEKRIATIMRVAELDKISLDKDGNIKDADKLKESIKTEWSDFIVSESTKGAGTETPPSNTGGKVTKNEEIYKKDDAGRYIHTASERQKMIADNLAAQTE